VAEEEKLSLMSPARDVDSGVWASVVLDLDTSVVMWVVTWVR
jgi:hypothetical protein